MSQKSGISPQVIASPKGGGALSGIGEKFSPDLFTGTGNFIIPIAVPPGRNGFQPKIDLVHSTGNSMGPFGLGWHLHLSDVVRKTSKGVPRYDDRQDTFILSGAEDLVPVPGGPPGAMRYRPRTEGLFAHIDHYRDAARDFWEVRTKDGQVHRYGTLGCDGEDPLAKIAKPSDRRRIFAWKLTETIDVFGNRIEYLYERDSAPPGSARRWDQLYVREIRYAEHDTPGGLTFVAAVRFFYDGRPDPFSERRAGFEIHTRRRCTRIEIVTFAPEETLVRSYHLTYLDQLDLPPEELPPNRVSLLAQIGVQGHDGTEKEALPPLRLRYTRFETRFGPETRRFRQVQGRNLPPVSLGHPDVDLADLFGRGLPDVVQMSGHTARYWRNRGGGHFDDPMPMKDVPAGLALGDPAVQLIDADGDARIDLMVASESQAGYFPMGRNGLWDRKSFHLYKAAPSFDLKDPEVKLVDLDGDGMIHGASWSATSTTTASPTSSMSTMTRSSSESTKAETDGASRSSSEVSRPPITWRWTPSASWICLARA